MLDCLLVGDMFSVALQMRYMPEHCQVVSRGWMTSREFNEEYPQNFNANAVIISLGMFDYKNINTEAELYKLRERVGAKTVFWILPIANLVSYKVPDYMNRKIPIKTIQKAIKKIADEYGDRVITIDHISTIAEPVVPSDYGYKDIARRIMEGRAGVEVLPVPDVVTTQYELKYSYRQENKTVDK